MSKQIDKDRVAAHVAGLLFELAGPLQPKVDDSLTLLVTGHQIDGGPMVDIYGEADSFGYEVADICITGTKVSLYGLISDRFVDGRFQSNGLLQALSAMCNDFLPSAEEMKEDSRQEALIDRAELNRELQP